MVVIVFVIGLVLVFEFVVNRQNNPALSGRTRGSARLPNLVISPRESA
jgi:hypothetical protein